MALTKILNEFGIADKVSIKMIPDNKTLTGEKVLSITCDNASCNNVTIAELTEVLPNFSKVGHTQCFLHIINLVAKSIIKQFDVQKKKKDEHLDNKEQELHNLAGDVDVENEQAVEAMEQHQISGETVLGDKGIDDIEGWFDKMVLLSTHERKQIEADIWPVKLVLVKVRYQQC